MDLEKAECSYNIPQLLHVPCSHVITACKCRGLDHESEKFKCPFYLMSNTLKVWESSFEPYLDPTQWLEYYRLDYVPDPDLLKTKKGRRKKKQLRGVMDASNGYGEDIVTPSVLPLKQLAKLCHEHHVFVIMHVIKCVDQFS